MKAKWFICNLGKDAAIQSLHYAALEHGAESRIVSLGDVASYVDAPSDDRDCVITQGSIWMNSALRKAHPNWIGNYHDKQMFCCSSYYPFWGNYLTQKNYLFMPFSEIVRQVDWLYKILAVDDRVFIRPDSGEKEFNGEIVHRERFSAWIEENSARIETLGSSQSLMCVVSSPIDIDKEFRLVIVDKKVVAGSTYRIARHLASESLSDHCEADVNNFAEKVLNDNPPPLPPFFVLDVALESTGEYSILEVGCFCCCGLYSCDRKKIASAITDCAERHFKELNDVSSI
jgi:hypothetical protein